MPSAAHRCRFRAPERRVLLRCLCLAAKPCCDTCSTGHEPPESALTSLPEALGFLLLAPIDAWVRSGRAFQATASRWKENGRSSPSTQNAQLEPVGSAACFAPAQNGSHGVARTMRQNALFPPHLPCPLFLQSSCVSVWCLIYGLLLLIST